MAISSCAEVHERLSTGLGGITIWRHPTTEEATGG